MYQPPYPMGGTDGDPLLREGHECPIKLNPIHCQNCFFSKDDGTGRELCDHPHGRDGSVAE